jgi:hypothetical protein
MQCDQAFLDIGAGAHLLRAADQHAHRTLPYLLEKRLLLRVGFGIADGGDLLAGDAVGDQLLDDFLVRCVAPRRRIDPHVGEYHLCAAFVGCLLPDGKDVFDQAVDF